MSYPILVLKPKKERSLLNRHPWVYSGAILTYPPHLKPGDTVSIHTHEGKHLGVGHYCQEGSIVCRVFDFSPVLPQIDRAYWTFKVKKAYALRAALGFSGDGDGYRLIYSEADGLPGLICDGFGDVAVIQAGTHGALGLCALLGDFLAAQGFEHIYMQSSLTEPYWLKGGAKEAQFQETGILISINIENAQKTGYFLDQRENRVLLEKYVKNKRVLDAFCHVGGFSLHAAKAGAKQVTSLDASKDAMVLCQKNMEKNGFLSIQEAVVGDCFEYFRTMPHEAFDAIVLDPPAFAKKTSMVQKAARGYQDLNRLALQKLPKGGMLFTFSCSQVISRELFRQIVYSAAKEAGRDVVILHQLSQAPDHPISVYHPEGDYLKGLVVRVE